eukprot:419026-Amphidinium_carterae.1
MSRTALEGRAWRTKLNALRILHRSWCSSGRPLWQLQPDALPANGRLCQQRVRASSERWVLLD